MSGSYRDIDVDRFGRWADSYDHSPLQRLIFAPLHDFTLQLAATATPESRRILDIGCGTGQLLKRAAHRFPGSELTGVDASPEMIEVANAAAPPDAPVHFLQAYAEALPFPDRSFDLVLTTMSFHHWADQPAALREVWRVLDADGVFALADALSVGLLRWLFVRGGHGRFNTPSALKSMLTAAGLEVERLVPAPGLGRTVQVALARRVA